MSSPGVQDVEKIAHDLRRNAAGPRIRKSTQNAYCGKNGHHRRARKQGVECVQVVRQLTIKDGPSFTEQLTRFNEKGKSFDYKIVESPLPITGYHSTFKVVSTGKNTSKVLWTGHFKRKNASDNPPKGEGDDDVVQLITGVYDGGLNNLKSQLEAH